MILVKNKRCSLEKLKKEYPGCVIIDVTSKGTEEWKKLSPFYPHGGIPVPFSDGCTSMSVEGIWQGLKVFEACGVNWDSFYNGTMKNLKRTVKRNGMCKGHQKGVYGSEMLGYIDARKQIYVPSYFWMLENKCKTQIEKLKKFSETHTVILLDYDINADVDDPRKPLSHASLICRYLHEN